MFVSVNNIISSRLVNSTSVSISISISVSTSISMSISISISINININVIIISISISMIFIFEFYWKLTAQPGVLLRRFPVAAIGWVSPPLLLNREARFSGQRPRQPSARSQGQGFWYPDPRPQTGTTPVWPGRPPLRSPWQ